MEWDHRTIVFSNCTFNNCVFQPEVKNISSIVTVAILLYQNSVIVMITIMSGISHLVKKTWTYLVL